MTIEVVVKFRSAIMLIATAVRLQARSRSIRPVKMFKRYKDSVIVVFFAKRNVVTIRSDQFLRVGLTGSRTGRFQRVRRSMLRNIHAAALSLRDTRKGGGSGWEAGIRTPISRSRFCRLTVGRPPSTNFSLPNSRAKSHLLLRGFLRKGGVRLQVGRPCL